MMIAVQKGLSCRTHVLGSFACRNAAMGQKEIILFYFARTKRSRDLSGQRAGTG